MNKNISIFRRRLTVCAAMLYGILTLVLVMFFASGVTVRALNEAATAAEMTREHLNPAHTAINKVYDAGAETLSVSPQCAEADVTYRYAWSLWADNTEFPLYHDAPDFSVANVADSGLYTVSVSVYKNSVFVKTLTCDFAVSVQKAELSVTLTGTTRRYGEDNDFGYTLSGFLGGQTITTVGLDDSMFTIDCAADPDSLPGEYPVAADGLSAPNYRFIYPADAVLTVVKLTVDTVPPAGTLSGVIGGTLSEVRLPAGFRWADETAVMDETGDEKGYPAIYNPDRICYEDKAVNLFPNVQKIRVTPAQFAQGATLRYTGAEQTFFVQDAFYYTVTGNTAIDAGTYTAKITVNLALCYIGYTENLIDVIDVSWEMLPAVITKPVDSVILTYSGAPISPTRECDGYSLYAAPKLNVGLYGGNDSPLVVTLAHKTNYIWDDGTTDDCLLDWEITPLLVKKPSLNAPVFTYDGQTHGINLINTEYYTVRNGTNVHAGAHIAQITLSGPNFAWDDETKSTGVLEAEYEILPAALPSDIRFTDAAFLYDGTVKMIAVTGLPIDVTVSYTNNFKTNGGVFEVKAVIATGGNYEPVDDLYATLTVYYAFGVMPAQNVAQDFLDGYVPGEKLPSPKRDGYSFDGWYYDAEYRYRVESVAADEMDANIYLYAKWTPRLYTAAIIFIILGGLALLGCAVLVWYFLFYKRRSVK